MQGFFTRTGGSVRLITPFDRAFVDALKEAIPWRHRDFDGSTKTWTIHEPYDSEALQLALDYYDDMEEVFTQAGVEREIANAFKTHVCITKEAPGTPHEVSECLRRVRHMHQEFAVLYLLPGAPWSVIQAAYRALVKLVHPDVAGSGSHQAMVEVNRAYEALERRRSVKV